MTKSEEIIHLTVSTDAGRIDKYLANALENMSRSKNQQLNDEENIIVNNQPTKSKHKVQAEDQIQTSLPEPEPIYIMREDIPLEIIYQYEDVVGINKPQ